MNTRDLPAPPPVPGEPAEAGPSLEWLLGRVARGDQGAFESLYDALAGPVYGLVCKVVRDPAQSEEVAQEVLLEVWRTASRFDQDKGSAQTWVMTIAHRRAVDRVRSVTAETARTQKSAAAAAAVALDEVAEAVEASLDRERVRRCLDTLTELQRESVTLAYYGGYSYREVAGLLSVALGTIKTRIRDGLIRMRDCLGGELVKLLRHDLHTLTGAYALDAIDGTERDRFEHHLSRCQSCGNEVRGLQDTAARLGISVARIPPPALKTRVMTAVASTRQLPPAADVRPARPSRHARPGPGRLPRLAVGLAAAAVAVAVTLGFLLASSQRQLTAAHSQQQAIAAVLGSPGARILTGRTSVGGTVTVVVARQSGKMIVTSTGLPALPGSKVYQLWLISQPRIRSAGLLPAAIAGRTAPVLASGLIRGDKLRLTVEPAGGTAQPTTTPVVLIRLY